MKLIRMGNARAQKSEDAVYQWPNLQKVAVEFRSFGHGFQRTSDFLITIDLEDVEKLIVQFAAMKEPHAIDLQRAKLLAGAEWKDVQTLIEKFCEAGHPDALALQEAMMLAQAAKELGWHPPKKGTAKIQTETLTMIMDAL
jgi:hypothetical protein